jgi:hypothetical protein
MEKSLKLILLLILLLISSCKSTATETTPPDPDVLLPADTTATSDLSENGDLPEIEESENLNPEPIHLKIPTKDNQEIEGIFYPARMNGAPVIVLMHWYPGDQYEWTEIAYWLQNRGLKGEVNGVPWKDPSWFPQLDPSLSYNVLSFSFTNCEGNCQEFLPDIWIGDAEAALKFARTLEGVDPNQIISIGASIGADGAIDGCAAVLQEDPSACLGALSLSPGNYLDIPYTEMVTALGENEPPRPAWCLFDQNDIDSAFCNEIEGRNYFKENWSDGNLHGMHLITPHLEPIPLERILEFIQLVSSD